MGRLEALARALAEELDKGPGLKNRSWLDERPERLGHYSKRDWGCDIAVFGYLKTRVSYPSWRPPQWRWDALSDSLAGAARRGGELAAAAERDRRKRDRDILAESSGRFVLDNRWPDWPR